MAKKKSKSRKYIWDRLNTLGNLLIVLSLFVLIVTFLPAAKEEVKYDINNATGVHYSLNPMQGSGERKLEPPNLDFSIVIPKIGAIAPIIDNVDPSNPNQYLPALRKGVAHAAGTKYPGEVGNTYLFAHSTNTFYNVSRFNAVFYLIGKLDAGDEIDIFYKGQRLIYKVYAKKIVDANASQYLGTVETGSTLTLQTCYPPGTTLKRLIVLAKLEG